MLDPVALAARLGLDINHLETRPLTGGVSSDIILLDDGHFQFVAKQSVPKLRVQEDWPCDPARIESEIAALRALAHTGAVPQVVSTDPTQHLYVMTVAPGQPWKSFLMRGDANPVIAEKIGRIHLELIQTNPTGFEDQSFFDDLRLDPYYRFAARRHPDLAAAFDQAIVQARRPIALTHGDWSPKNIMVTEDAQHVTALDFECIHLGDPAFDAAFMLNHLALKSIHLASPPTFLPAAQAYLAAIAASVPWPDILVHLPCLLLARVDGKSPVEYIQDESQKNRVRHIARDLLSRPPGSLEETWVRLKG